MSLSSALRSSVGLSPETSVLSTFLVAVHKRRREEEGEGERGREEEGEGERGRERERGEGEGGEEGRGGGGRRGRGKEKRKEREEEGRERERGRRGREQRVITTNRRSTRFRECENHPLPASLPPSPTHIPLLLLLSLEFPHCLLLLQPHDG